MADVDDWEAEADGEEQTLATTTPTTTPAVVQPTEAPKPSTNGEEEDDEDVSSDEDDHEDYDSKVLSSYRKLTSRRVDLVGDYAGAELFIIDGDSMLLRCFSDDDLDFDQGFQLLHAVYNVEQFLTQLVKRKCNFHVVFVDSNRLCVPQTAKPENSSKYLLARAVLIRHLKKNLSGTVEIHEFPSYTSNEFEAFCTLTSPFFLMAHDGSSHIARNGNDQGHSPTRVGLRAMILDFVLRRGLNVALLNGLETRDSKAIGMVLERRDRSMKAPTTPETANAGKSDQDATVEADLKALLSHAPQLTERQRLAVLAVKRVLDGTTSAESSPFAYAFLVHQALLPHLPLSVRRLPIEKKSEHAQNFLQEIAAQAESILLAPAWNRLNTDPKTLCDLADAVDGRLYLQTSKRGADLSSQAKTTLSELLDALLHLTGMAISNDPESPTATNGTITNGTETSSAKSSHAMVMPFSNAVFDKHMTSIRLEIDEYAAGPSPNSHRIFQEVTHWHNAKKPLIVKAPPTKASAKEAFWKAKKDQLFAAEVQKYAASLTNAIGRSLEPESIIVGASKNKSIAQPNGSGRATPDSDSAESSSSQSKNKGPPKKGGKKGQPNAGKQAMLNTIALTKAKKDDSMAEKISSAWQVVCKGIELDSSPKSRYLKAQSYLAGLPSASMNVISAEVRLYMLSSLLQHWSSLSKEREGRHRDVAALIWSICGEILGSSGLTSEIVGHVEDTIRNLDLPVLPSSVTASSLPSRKLAFTFTKLRTTGNGVDLDPKSFQLYHAGPYLERSFDSRPDSRVDFKPDGWQRRVLDAIDADQSVFAVAPTSAGKTFISFYAMRKILEADDDGVLVYVAPTKALVNQIAAEIQARYSKKFKYGGKSVWAIHTRDYRINSPTGCQVLVTVPHVLQIMLMAPTNANSWSGRVKRIIFDEVHSIGQAEDGVVWEQLLLMSPCPVVALSATVGNPDEFSDWLSTTQGAIGNELVTVQHPYRYSDLRKYYYNPPQQFAFQGLPTVSHFGTLGLENSPGLNHIHPVAALVDRARKLPEDLALEPQDCLELYNALKKHSTAKYPIDEKLDPKNALPSGPLKKVDVIHWEHQLKDVLQKWIEDRQSPYDDVLKDLEHSFRDPKKEAILATRAETTVTPVEVTDDLDSTTLPLLCRLHEQNALPAIFFNYDRLDCERVARSLLEQLQDAEEAQVKSGQKWEKKLERWEEWKKVQEKLAKGAKSAKKKTAGKGDDGDEEKSSKLDQQRDAGAAEVSSWDSFDPEAPVDGYHLADHSKVLPSEMDIYERQLQRRDIQQWLIDGLKRGIGIHHAGMNRKYRQICEILFRKKFLTVVIATGTLALGINMPAKTVVFAGDSVFLTALNYRQCAGRAGRRGFDLLGNVVFQGMTREKVCRLISSRLPDLNGHFPITTTLCLRLFTLLSESNNSKYASSAINALLSQPRLYMGGESFKDQTMHHLRFSIEYLRRQHLLSAAGTPLNFAGLVSHLYFTENSAFAFHALLKEGYFHELCAGIKGNEKQTLETMMLVMANLFNRRPCRQADAEVLKRSSSIVFLPPLPEKAAAILRKHNDETLEVYRAYVETFVDQHVKTEDRTLPLTRMQMGASSDSDATATSLKHLPPTKSRSSFVALSGLGDDFSTISDLCKTTREGVFLEEAVIPYVGVSAAETGQVLNAWLLDFYKHGDVFTIERANGIRRSEIWFMLNDFSLVLATLIASLMGYMKLNEGTDMAMLDVMGNLDAHEEAEDEQAIQSEDTSNEQGEAVPMVGTNIKDTVGSAMAERPKIVAKSKAKKAETWEDVADEEETMIKKEDHRAEQAANAGEGAAWAGQKGDEGLKTILTAFTKLHAEFTMKFRAMWA